MKKKYQFRIYENDGSTIITTLSPNEIRNDVSFTSVLSGGPGELRVTLNRSFTDFDEGDSIAPDNIVEVYVQDENHTAPFLIYRGYISRYTPFLKGREEGVELSIVGIHGLLSRDYFKNGVSFSVIKTSQDPSQIARDIIDNANTKFNFFSYDSSSVINTGKTISKTFIAKRWFEALKETIKFAIDTSDNPYFWFIDSSGKLYFKKRPTTATHTFTIGKDIQEITAIKDFERIENEVTVGYSGGSDVTKSDTASITENGRHSSYYAERDLNLTSATEFADKKLFENADPKINTKLIINTNYDIETIKPLDTCKIRNIDETQETFNDNMLIKSVDYTPDFVVLELEEITNYGVELFNFITKISNA